MYKYGMYVVTGLIIITALAWPKISVCADAKIQMDILFMNHGPMQPTIREIKAIAGKYSGELEVHWHDSDLESGEQFMKKNNIQGHIPLLIFIDGTPSHEISGRQVTFMGFPNGAGPFQFRGQWSMEDLEAVISSRTTSK